MKTIHKFILFNIIFFAATACSFAQSQSKPSHAGKFTLIDGMISMEYRYMEFINTKGDSVYAYEYDSCITANGYQQLWDTVGPPRKIAPQMLNKKYKVTYSSDSIPNPFNQDQAIMGMTITKMELLK
jgi:hypothetical protein